MYLQHRAQPYVDGGANTRAESSTVVGLTKILRCSAPSLFFLCSPLPHATGIIYCMGQSQMNLMLNIIIVLNIVTRQFMS